MSNFILSAKQMHDIDNTLQVYARKSSHSGINIDGTWCPIPSGLRNSTVENLRELYRMNIIATNGRYPDDQQEPESTADMVIIGSDYSENRIVQTLTPVELLKGLNCLHYNSVSDGSTTPENKEKFEKCEKWVVQIERILMGHIVSNSAEYEAAEWAY